MAWKRVKRSKATSAVKSQKLIPPKNFLNSPLIFRGRRVGRPYTLLQNHKFGYKTNKTCVLYSLPANKQYKTVGLQQNGLQDQHSILFLSLGCTGYFLNSFETSRGKSGDTITFIPKTLFRHSSNPQTCRPVSTKLYEVKHAPRGQPRWIIGYLD